MNGGQPPIQQGYNGMSVNNIPEPMQFDNVGKAPSPFVWDKEMILKIVSIVGGAFFLLALFIPYYTSSSFGIRIYRSFWDENNELFFKLFWLILGVIPIVSFFFPKMKKLSYLTAGWGLSLILQICGSPEDFGEIFNWIKSLFQYRFIGWYLLVLGSVALLVVNLIEDIPTMFKKDDPKPAPKTGQLITVNPPVGAPTNTVQPVAQNVVICGHCGQPKKNPTDQFCQRCGQRYE